MDLAALRPWRICHEPRARSAVQFRPRTSSESHGSTTTQSGDAVMAAKKQAPKPARKSPARRPAGARSGQSDATRSIAQTSARSTMSGPSHKGGPADISDLATAKMAGTETVAAAMPHNAAKPSEFGGGEPAVGQAVEPPHPIVGASTLSETNASQKAG